MQQSDRRKLATLTLNGDKLGSFRLLAVDLPSDLEAEGNYMTRPNLQVHSRR